MRPLFLCASPLFTGNQRNGFPEIESSGCTVVVKGKPPYTGGTEIKPTEVNIFRQEDLE